MGYEIYEQPMIDATIYYYDKGYCTTAEFCENLLLSLKKHRYDYITNIELGKHKLTKGILENYVVRYSKKDVSKLDLQAEVLKWVNDNDVAYISLVHKEKRRWMWDITWHKNYKLSNGVSVSDYTFNHLTMMSSYECLENKDAQTAYVDLFCELCDLFEAFYGKIEDVATAVSVLNQTKETVFNHERIQAVYWGNYFGKHYCSEIGIETFKRAPACITKSTHLGIFLSMTNNLLDSKNNPDYRKRKKLFRHLTQQGS